MDNLDKFILFREKYPEFIYHNFSIVESEEEIKIEYFFEIVGLSEFHPTWIFKKGKDFNIEKVGKSFFENLVFNLGLVELVSYWKITCSPKVEIQVGNLNEEQRTWWKKLYLNGLGEFLYTNGIYSYLQNNNIELIEIICQNEAKMNFKPILHLKGNLIPVGGGKDSVVTLELLKDMKKDNTCFIVNPRGASKATAEIAGYTEKYAPKRTLDTNMLELNKQGFLNGHTPFSAILAFSSYISAVILSKKYIILSNEASANEPNVKGTNINHQYSKSLEFENDFREYSKKFLCENGPEYFSLLRPWTEWQIVREFVKYDKYFSEFKSCNVGSKQDIWCENCPKCLYVYIMLSAFLDEEKMKRIFKTNMLDNFELKNIFLGLIEDNVDKPFECVGMKEEINLSLNMYIRRLIKERKTLPLLLKDYTLLEENEYLKLLEEYSSKYIQYNNVNNIFEQFLKEVE